MYKYVCMYWMYVCMYLSVEVIIVDIFVGLISIRAMNHWQKENGQVAKHEQSVAQQ